MSGLLPSCLDKAGSLQRLIMAVLARCRGTEKAKNWALLGPTEEAESGTRWHRCGHWCCLPGQVQEAVFLLWMWLSCHPAHRTVKNYRAPVCCECPGLCCAAPFSCSLHLTGFSTPISGLAPAILWLDR